MGLPPLELPPDALVLFESLPGDDTRSGAHRFVVTHDGRFLHSGNAEVEETAQEPFWATALEHLASFDAATVDAIAQAAHDVERLPTAIRTPPGKESHPTFERITVRTAGDGPPHTTVANARARPQQVAKLLEIVERAGAGQS